MAARGNFKLADPLGVDMTLTITMSVTEWKIVKSRMTPAASDGEWYLDAAIADMIENANKYFHFYATVEASKE
jgi:hypothetical protein